MVTPPSGSMIQVRRRRLGLRALLARAWRAWRPAAAVASWRRNQVPESGVPGVEDRRFNSVDCSVEPLGGVVVAGRGAQDVGQAQRLCGGGVVGVNERHEVGVFVVEGMLCRVVGELGGVGLRVGARWLEEVGVVMRCRVPHRG